MPAIFRKYAMASTTRYPSVVKTNYIHDRPSVKRIATTVGYIRLFANPTTYFISDLMNGA